MAVKTPPRTEFAIPANGNGAPETTGEAPVAVDYRALGRTGLKQWWGRIDEEFLKELKVERKYPVYREMSENDPTIGALLKCYEYLIRGVTWRMQPQDQNDDAQVQMSEEIDRRRTEMERSWPEVLSEILSFLPFGWSFHEVLYETRPDGIWWKDWPIRAQESLYKWLFVQDQNGKDTDELAGLVQLTPTDSQFYTIPIDKGLLFRLSTAKNNPEGKSIIRNAYLPWYYKNHIQRIEAIGIERDLAGYPVLYVPGEVLENVSGQPFAAAQRTIANIRRDEQEGALLSSARDAQGNRLWELTLLSTGGQRSFDTNTIIQRYDQRILMSCMADFLLIGHEKVGSFALASTKTDVFALALNAVLDSICEVINRQAIPRLAELNGWPVDQLPQLTHGDIEMPDLEEVGRYITALSGAGVPLFPDMKLENRLREIGNFPQITKDEFDEREAMIQADQQAQADAKAAAAQQAKEQAASQQPAIAGQPKP